MTTESLKSVPIVNSDAFPIILNDVGSGAAGYLRTVEGHIAATTGVTSPSLYRLIRIPRDAKIKRLFLTNAALSTSTAADISIAFSDSTTDGTQISFSSLTNPIIQITGPTDNKLFGSAVSLSSAQNNQDQTFSNNYTTNLRNYPVWQALVFFRRDSVLVRSWRVLRHCCKDHEHGHGGRRYSRRMLVCDQPMNKEQSNGAL